MENVSFSIRIIREDFGNIRTWRTVKTFLSVLRINLHDLLLNDDQTRSYLRLVAFAYFMNL